ncbi:MobE homing endonuclease [Sinorhizobium phage phiM7]|uniref:MobE homing endonuclease n=2 Tax=Emdodecavirus TaxID=1980937 RepID=A0A0F6WBK5_9CAUD|nr:homing endonuclease [Sinorhizobium phage phiM12]YP_009601159.1 homing endonuclease [Sinorhizobium phage phiM7]AGR47680.2 putative homing endonuclease [Sinorhizobium phage phiM12]AKF12582.1 MobE homing endonuclease [Sinorhizobium phage phiM7]AKF12942.1 MobE homing endonuclease [Sinorhizobium phage phiM19]
MFNSSKYTRWYFEIVDSAKSKNRNKSGEDYFESHHIIPKSLGGNNSKENRVLLTAREHFIVHWLLTKMVDDKSLRFKMACALNRMTQSNSATKRNLSSRKFELARRIFAREMSDKKTGKRRGPLKPETRAKMSEVRTGKKFSKETRAKMSAWQIKTYHFLDPNGNHVIVDNMVEFCAANNLDRANMSSLWTGKYRSGSSYKGWTKYDPTLCPTHPIS